MSGHLPRGAWGWALYDFANSAFPTTVMAGFFPIFFKEYWSAGVAASTATFWLGASVSVASLVVALAAPLLGARADATGRHKAFLLAAMLVGITATLALALIGRGAWPSAAFAYVLALAGFLLANVFYDSLLVPLCGGEKLDLVSGLGYGLGYLGGGLLFLQNVLMVQHPSWFGLADEAAAVKVSFLLVGGWWLLFSLPLLLGPLGREAGERFRPALPGWSTLRALCREVLHQRQLRLFLLAYWLYIDGVDTIITMAVDFGKNLGFSTGDLIGALLLVQFTGFPFALLFGWLGGRVGPRTGILLAVAVYLLVTVFAANLETAPLQFLGFEFSQFHLLALLLAMVQGGIQSLSRSYFARLVPPHRAAEYFGLYNLLGKFAAILGPLLLGIVVGLSGNPRAGILSVALLFLAGGAVLVTLPEESRA
ncbi:MAG: hypothetical protein A2284_07935 [Deltaproteobacteria bacterium RIFOXYA12_FULL_61_11]|nr:MAG: hypothetical protein A2284_07935 [Deltaproteobacteria bacterium RIFOXYA12_FULL_61_11]